MVFFRLENTGDTGIQVVEISPSDDVPQLGISKPLGIQMPKLRRYAVEVFFPEVFVSTLGIWSPGESSLWPRCLKHFESIRFLICHLFFFVSKCFFST